MHMPHLSRAHRLAALSRLLSRHQHDDASLSDFAVFAAYDLDGNLLLAASAMLAEPDPHLVHLRPSALGGWVTADRRDPHWTDLSDRLCAPVTHMRPVVVAMPWPAPGTLLGTPHGARAYVRSLTENTTPHYRLLLAVEATTPHQRRRRLPTLLTTPAGDAVVVDSALRAELGLG